jgi:predicted RNA-binding protein
MISVKEILVEKYDNINYEPCVSEFNFHFENSYTSFNPTTFQPSTIIPFSVVVESEKYIDKFFLNHNKRKSRDYIFNKFIIEVNENLTKEFIKNKKQFNSSLFNGLKRDISETFDLKEMFFKFLDIKKESLRNL